MTYFQTTRGVALISVMVVVAVVAASAAQLLYRQNIDIERSTRIMSREQAFLFAFGLETYARELLAQDSPAYDYEVDFSRYQKEDGRIEVWSWPIPNEYMSDAWLETFGRVGGAKIEAQVRDLSGLFNLNGVYQAVQERKPDGTPTSSWEEMYRRTFKNLINAAFSSREENAPDADALWNALTDWFDKDDDVEGGGAEDPEYLERDPPYLTGQGRMAWPEEIRLIEGFDGRVAERLLPLMSALPSKGDRVRLNINTAPSELLRHMPDDGGFDYAGVIRDRRADELYFRSEEDVKRALDDAKAFGNTPVHQFFDVKSNFFLFTACVGFGRDRPIEIQSLLWRRPPPDTSDGQESQPPVQGGKDRVVVMQRRMGKGYYKGDARCA